MQREQRYLVAKNKDVEKYLTREQQVELSKLHAILSLKRLKDGKPVLDVVCVEADWPEYEPVWQMIEKRVDGV